MIAQLKSNSLHAFILSHCCSQLFGGGGGKRKEQPATDSSEQFDFGFSSSLGAAASNREQLDTEKLDGLRTSSNSGRNQRNAVPQRPAFGQRANTDAAAAGGRQTL
jgi:hypothetical protein